MKIRIGFGLGTQTITNDAGTSARGTASKLVSGSTGNILYFLATGFGQGFQVEVENGGRGRVAFCLEANECYLCN